MNADSVKARLKNYAEENNRTFQEALVYYGLERTIYRISVSRYADYFTLKGGIFLYALFKRNYARATTDIDLRAIMLSNDRENMKEVFSEIFSIEADDALIFDLKSLNVGDISIENEYQGVNISIVAYLNRARIPISIDIGFGDAIYPEAVEMDFPVLLDMDAPRIYAYSVESVIAEKLEATVSNGLLNSRYKDFYDIYMLSLNFHFDEKKLSDAIIETFTQRGTTMSSNIAALTEEYYDDITHKNRWNGFAKKKKAMVTVTIEETMMRISDFLIPILTDIENNNITSRTWNPQSGIWEK